MKKPCVREKLSYRFDKWIARGLAAMMILLLAVTVTVAIVLAVIAHLWTPENAGSMGDSIWNSFMHILDAGNVAGDYETRNLRYILLMILAGIWGLFVTSILIGMITTSLQTKLESLRHGNAKVLEKGHTLILGYDEHLSTVIQELISAEDGKHSPAVVVLCEHDRCKMEEELRVLLQNRCKKRIICRKGDPTSFIALQNAGIGQCGHIITLGENDFRIVAEILAARTLLNDLGVSESVNVSAVITQQCNIDAAQIAGECRLEVLYFQRLIARIFAQTCRQTGLSKVYQELFGFQGDEIYLEPAQALAGKTFGEILLFYRKAAVIGLRQNGQAKLNPPADTKVGERDEVIVIASYKGAAVPMREPGVVDAGHIRIRKAGKEAPLKILVLGKNRMVDEIIDEIAQYAAEGSVLTAAAKVVENEKTKEARKNRLLVHRVPCEIYNNDELNKLLDGFQPDRIIVLAEQESDDPDAHTLTLLLQLNHYYQDHYPKALIVSEMLSKKNQALATCTRVNDFVVGSNLASLVLTQVSQNRVLYPLFEELLTDDGNEIYIRPVSRFVETGVPMNLYTLAQATLQTGQLFLGLRLRCVGGGAVEICLNPDKDTLYNFTPNDCVIVLAED